MPGITGQGTTFNLPNYVGDLFSISPSDTPLLSAIGGLTGGESVQSKRFGWEYYSLRDAEEDRQRVEGADAPAPEARVREFASNVVEIHQEAVEVSYTKQATPNYIDAEAAGVEGSNPVRDEMAWQVDKHLAQVARDIERTFIRGTFAEPSDNTEPRQTRGLLEAIETNVTDLAGENLSQDDVDDAMQKAWESGGLAEGETATLVAGASVKRMLTKLYIKDAGFAEESRNVGGVNLQTIETDFGRLNLMLNREMPSNALLILSMEELTPVFLLIPNKGFLFVEDLAKLGAAERKQIYGEVGLRYGAEHRHAKIVQIGAVDD